MKPTGRQRLLRASSRAGFFVSVAVVFACGWFGMRATDWRKMVSLAALAAVAGLVASGFSRHAR